MPFRKSKSGEIFQPDFYMLFNTRQFCFLFRDILKARLKHVAARNESRRAKD
jgi:hypothetical protein